MSVWGMLDHWGTKNDESWIQTEEDAEPRLITVGQRRILLPSACSLFQDSLMPKPFPCSHRYSEIYVGQVHNNINICSIYMYIPDQKDDIYTQKRQQYVDYDKKKDRNERDTYLYNLLILKKKINGLPYTTRGRYKEAYLKAKSVY